MIKCLDRNRSKWLLEESMTTLATPGNILALRLNFNNAKVKLNVIC